MKIFRILLAWWYVLISRNNEVSRKRLVICSHCDKRKRFTCGVCGCPLIAKSRLEDEPCEHPNGDKWK
jgi:hypothetical protein